MSSGPEPLEWVLKSRQLLHQCPIFDVCSHRLVRSDGAMEHDFTVLEAPDWVMTIPILGGDTLVLVRQFRFGVRKFTWEFPAGVMDPGEDPVDTARRELEEETGYRSARGTVIAEVNPNPAFINNTCYIVLLDELAEGQAGGGDAFEQIEVRLMPVEEAFRRGEEGYFGNQLVEVALNRFRPIWRARQIGSGT